MNTLTKNRILQQGDEYFEPTGGKGWIPVPQNDYGLQIQFTPYKEVRRPSEKPFPAPNGSSNDSHPAPTARNVQTSEGVKRSPSPDTVAQSVPQRTRTEHAESGREPIKMDEAGLPPRRPECKISPDNVALTTALPNVAKAEKETTLAPTPSGAGEPHPASYLPTIVSKKAHTAGVGIKYDSGEIVKTLRETPETVNDSRTEVAKSPVSPTLSITFPKPDPTDLVAVSNQPIWTGRNGTFTGYGLEAMIVDRNIMLSPIGKRGIGNCTIQFPISEAAKVASWLLEQATPK